MLGMPNSALVPVAKLLREPPRNGISPSVNSDGEGLKTVSISAVSDGIFDPTGCIKHAKIDADVACQFFVKRGDAFVIRGNGNRQLCGKVGLSDESHDELFYPDLLIRLRFDTNKILPQFAVAQWNLPSVHRRLSARAKSSNGIWKVNGQDIRAHHLFAPAPAEQRSMMGDLATLRAGLWNVRGGFASSQSHEPLTGLRAAKRFPTLHTCQPTHSAFQWSTAAKVQTQPSSAVNTRTPSVPHMTSGAGVDGVPRVHSGQRDYTPRAPGAGPLRGGQSRWCVIIWYADCAIDKSAIRTGFHSPAGGSGASSA